VCSGVHNVITGNKFYRNRSRGFRATVVRKLGSPIDLACRPYNSSALPCWLWWRNYVTVTIGIHRNESVKPSQLYRRRADLIFIISVDRRLQRLHVMRLPAKMHCVLRGSGNVRLDMICSVSAWYLSTRSTGTVHTSAKARLTSVAIRIRILIRIRIRDPDCHQNLSICSMAHCKRSLKISCKSVRKFFSQSC